MSDRLEWAAHTSGAELLFPGEDIDGATVDTGEMAVAFWTGSNGIALSGPPEQLAARLEQAAAVVRAAAALVQDPVRHLPDGLDPWTWIILGTDTDSPTEHANTICRTPGITVRDPRRVTCGDCITTWNDRFSNTYAVPCGTFTFPTARPIPHDPADHTIADQLPYAGITWIDMYSEGDEEELPGDDAYDGIDDAVTTD
ncbi:hypothetical protein [Streptomyces sp. NPDC055140]